MIKIPVFDKFHQAPELPLTKKNCGDVRKDREFMETGADGCLPPVQTYSSPNHHKPSSNIVTDSQTKPHHNKQLNL